MKVFGLKNCDTCRKARKALNAADVEFSFNDVREDGVTKTQITKWAKSAGWEKLLNKSSATWRSLSNAEKDGVTEKKAIALMTEHPTLIKRPVIENGKSIMVGWTADVQKTLLA